MRRRAIIYIGVLLAVFIGDHSPIAAQTTDRFALGIDTPAIRIGEQIHAVLTYTGKGDPATVKFPLVHDTLASGIEVLEQSEPDTSLSDDGQFVLTVSYVITSFDSGTYVIDKLYATRIVGKDTARLQIAPVTLDVFTLTVAEEEDIRDIKGPLGIPLAWREILPWLLLVLGLGLFVLILWLYLRSRKSGKPIFQALAKPRLPAHVKALDALETLRRKKLWQDGKYKEYHSELTEIIRQYIDERYGVPALEMVTHEIMGALHEIPELQEHIMNDLQQVFNLADMVKFAKAHPLPDENDNSLKVAREFIRSTAQKVDTSISEPDGQTDTPDVNQSDSNP